MREQLNFYIDGKWVPPVKANPHDVINPSNEEPCGRISLGSAADVDKAVAAARKAFTTYSQTSIDERKALLDKIIAIYQRRMPEMAETISMEMGAPLQLAQTGGDIGPGDAQRVGDLFQRVVLGDGIRRQFFDGHTRAAHGIVGREHGLLELIG